MNTMIDIFDNEPLPIHLRFGSLETPIINQLNLRVIRYKKKYSTCVTRMGYPIFIDCKSASNSLARL